MVRKKLKTAALYLIGLTVITLIYLALIQNLPITKKDGEILINIAESGFQGEEYTGRVSQRLVKKTPVFVSVYENGSRVSCLGYTRPLFPLYESVEYLSKGVESDYEGAEIVITVFDSYRELREGENIPDGQGVLVKKEGFEGVVLPFTFSEMNLTDEKALYLAANKAGFTSFNWQDFEVFTFEAHVFHSKDY